MSRIMLSVAVLQLALLFLGVACVTAGYTACDDPVTCADNGAGRCCTYYNGYNYCCPGSGNSFNLNTLQCANYAQCGQSYNHMRSDYRRQTYLVVSLSASSIS
jgi:hypothetical protein